MPLISLIFRAAYESRVEKTIEVIHESIHKTLCEHQENMQEW